ncbi:Hypothetical predicted protein [Mytilus galloprovincialis]|uniref:C1q domain-containing protein n=2 Tax=Mytilus galloprovincialis TaxID=29158 RepID=A0A8B6H3L0_MYTGA|nr:Hypothetical predicted protein [Mytilus galloprovincialis]
MIFTMQFCFLSCIMLSLCHGFLLANKTGISSVGTPGLTDSHYLILTDALGVQKQLLSQMETFVLRLQNELKTVNQEVKDLKSGNSAGHSFAIVELKNETSELRGKSAQLQKSYDVLQKKFDTIQNENNVLKHDNTALKLQMSNWNNFSVLINQKLNSFTHSIAASNIQNVTTIQSSVDTLKSQVKLLNTRFSSLSWTSTSRGQDFLALLDKSNVADLKLETFEQNYALDGNSTKDRFQSLEQNFTSLSSEIRTLKGKVQDMNQPVALTSCISSSVDYRKGQIIKFPVTKTSIGINNVTEFHTTGTFTCETSGVYLLAVHIANSGNSNAVFALYKNSKVISYVMVVYGTHSTDYNSGSGTVVVEMKAGDILLAKAIENFNVQGFFYSCFTVLKIN